MLARHLKIIIPGLAAFLLSATAHAELINTTYTDTNGEPASSGPDAEYMNPTGQITFALSAGLDRKVRVELRRPSGELIEGVTSALIGASDKITVDGNTFFGVRLTLSGPEEGDYVTVAKILDNNDEPVQTDQHAWALDRTGYEFDGTPRETQYSRYDMGRGNWDLISGTRELTLSAPINGEGAPAESAVLTTTAQSSGQSSTFSGFTVTDTNVSSVLSRGRSLWPDREDHYGVDMAVTDAAGNTTHTRWQTRFDAVGNPYAVLGITYEGDDRPHPWANVDALEEFTPYEPGMIVDNARPRLLLSIDSDQIYPDNIFGQYKGGYCTSSNNDFCLTHDVKYRADGKAYFFSRRSTMRSYETRTYTVRGNDLADNIAKEYVKIAAKPGVAVRPLFDIKSIKYVDGDVTHGRYASRNATQDERYDEVRLKLAESYSYPISVRDEWGDSITIPAGQTQTTLETLHKYTRYLAIRMCPDGANDVCQTENTSVRVDNTPPELESWSYRNASRGQYRALIKEKYNTTSNAWGISKAILVATSDDGVEQIVDPASHKNDSGGHTFVFPLGSLSSGHYSFSLRATDKFDNKSAWNLESRTYDGNAPTVALKAYDEPLGEQPLETLGDINLVVDDDNAQAEPDSVQLIGGPAGETINLAWTKQGEGRYALEYPIMFPSLEDGDYQVVAKVIDPTGNIATAANSFSYEPLRISMAQDSQGTVTIPAVTHGFQRENGGELIHTQPFKLYDGSILQGTYDVYATVRADATVPLLINGVRVEPGQTLSVVGDHDFASSGGSLNIPVAAAVTDQTGTANVLVSTSAPGAAVVSTRVKIWTANVELDAPTWTVHQAIDEIEVDATPDSETYCEVTTNERRAKRASLLDEPVCYLAWDALPLGAVPAHKTVGHFDGPGVRGRAYQQGEQAIEYSVWVYDYEGNPYLLQQASRTLTVADPDGQIAFSPGEDIAEVYHAVQSLDFGLEQDDGPECLVTTSVEEATRNGGSRRLTCLIEWTSMPVGLEQIDFRDRPQVRGHADMAGSNELAWRVSAFSRTGEKIVLNEQSIEIDSVPPPAPDIVIDDDNLIENGMYASPLEGGYVGDAKIKSYNSSLDVTMTRAGDTIDSMTSPDGWGARNVVQRRIKSDERALWSQTQYGIRASYALLNGSEANKSFTVLAVPSNDIAPVIEADGDTVLNTEPLKVNTRMENPFEDEGYDPATMGEWQIRIVSLRGRDVTPITDYQATPASGAKSFTLDLDEIDEKRLRLAAQARIVSPVAGYKRIVLSRRPVYMTVLRGHSIDSTIEGRRITGEAPLTAVMTLRIGDRLDRAALGEVKWQVSADKQSWSELESTSRYKTRFTHRFERGNYFVRAIVTNKNSEAKFQTPTVTVSAYLLPGITLDGPETAFIGATADYKAARDPSSDGNDPGTPLVYQWSTDRGEVWVDGEPSFHISRAEEARFPIWVRARYETAPGEDDDAWTRERTRLSFRKVRPPRVRIIGPRLVETGDPRDFRATVRAPYRKMDVDIQGGWALPGDSQSDDGRELTYTATDADLSNERVDLVYTTWIDGYKAQGAVDDDTHTLRIWQYEWPQFHISTRQGSDYAPGDAVTRLRSLGTTRFRDLEKPVVEWTLPEGLVVSDKSRDTIRKFVAEQPGEYSVQAEISDARGHSATVSTKLAFKPAPPYEFDFRYTASNRYNRAPMEIRMRPYISGGHPRDRIETYRYTLDGQPVETESRFGEMQIDEAGAHRIGITIETQMGNTASGELELVAKENQKPTCKLRTSSSRTYWRFYARCDDPDGRMADYDWTLNGEPVGTTSYRITVRNEGEGAPSVRVIGKDDAGAASDPLIWHGDP